MLYGIPAGLPAGLLQVLASMGHGDEIVVVDANYPAESASRNTHIGEPVEVIGRNAPDVVADILALMPLDAFVDNPVVTMEVPGNHDSLPPVHQEVTKILESCTGGPWPLQAIDRFDFYDRAAQSFAIVRTLERRPYGNYVLKKGVLTPDGDLMTPEFANRVG